MNNLQKAHMAQLCQLKELRHTWGGILLLIYWPTSHSLKKKEKKLHAGEWWKTLDVLGMNPAFKSSVSN